ncbi:DinB family protein [Cellulomonas wangsupingiae]|uniref:DinB family protein n=1 Tax=Cellulomonas wangsupingiae TaxID=2968085 RepID=UPI001D0E45C5|nr:DinB family protein [Cellulomonas wangsupingiae]MCM0638776.1 DinB family protein [Cellulomonas wangsupingiae]
MDDVDLSPARLTPERDEPPHRSDEAGTLLGFLDFHRRTLLLKLDGLDADALRRPLPPSTMTLGGLMKHLAMVEDNWFGVVWHDAPHVEPWASVDWKADRDWEWTSAADDSPEHLRSLWDDAVERSQRTIAAALAAGGLDQVSARPHRLTGEPVSLRWILVHMIEEYARHNGHADLLREAVDGTTGE